MEEEIIYKIIEAGRYTQTGANMQDVSFTIVRERLQELRELSIESLKEKGEDLLANLNPQTMKFKMFAVIWIKMYKDFKTNPNENDKIFYNAPVIIVVTADSETNGALASSNMELMTNAIGLGCKYQYIYM